MGMEREGYRDGEIETGVGEIDIERGDGREPHGTYNGRLQESTTDQI